MPRSIVLERVATGYRPTDESVGSVFGCVSVSAEEQKFDEAVHLWAWDGGRVCASEQGRGRGRKAWRASLMWVVDAGARGLSVLCLLSCLLADASMDGRLLARRLAKLWVWVDS